MRANSLIVLIALACAIAGCSAEKTPQPETESTDGEETVVEKAESEDEAEEAASEEAAAEGAEQAAEGAVETAKESADAPAAGDGEVVRERDVKNIATNKALESEVLGGGPLKDVFGDQKGFDQKMNRSMSGEGGELVVGRGSGGMGMRGTGGGGGGQGFGRVGGLGKVDTGGGRGVGGTVGSAARGSIERRRRVPNTEAYKDHGVNEVVSTDKDNLSTFSIDVDTGSYTISRRKLRAGQKPPAASVRVEEFINYFQYDYPEPTSGPFAVHMEAAPSPFHPDLNRKLLRIGVQGKRVKGEERKPVHLTFLVDVSGSMQSADKLALAQKSLELLTRNLQEGDTVAIATYAGRVAEILEPTGIDNRSRILGAIDGLRSGGSTAMNSGLELAYKLALANYQKDHVNRVIVMSDGDANVGPSSHQQILDRIDHFVDEGVTLSTIGFGMGNYKDTMMEQLANNGNGNYYYIDSMNEARKVFGEQLNGTLQVIAKDVKIQVEFNPKAVSGYRLVGYENRDIADEDFRDDKVDAGEIGAGHTVTALYEVVLKDTDEASLGTVRVRHKKPDEAKASEQAFGFSRAQLRDDLKATSHDFQFAAAVASFAEILRDSPYAKQLSYALVEDLAEASADGRADRLEFLSLVRNAKALK
jgi:Ca-activated chloride channel family protein